MKPELCLDTDCAGGECCEACCKRNLIALEGQELIKAIELIPASIEQTAAVTAAQLFITIAETSLLRNRSTDPLEGWIRIKDLRPMIGKTVIVANINTKWVSVRSLGPCDDDINPKGLWYHESDLNIPMEFESVTHWRPMPPPPNLFEDKIWKAAEDLAEVFDVSPARLHQSTEAALKILKNLVSSEISSPHNK